LANPVGLRRRIPASGRRSAIVVFGAALMLVSPAAAQSPSPSAAPAASVVPLPSVSAPAASVVPLPSVSAPAGLAAIEAGLATQACESFLPAATLTSTAGVTVTGISGGSVEPESKRRGFIGLDCTYAIDGGTVRLLVSEREWKGKGKPKTSDLQDANDRGYSPEATKLAGPGDAAYSDPGSDRGYYPGTPNVTWSLWIKHGKAFADRWLGLASDVLDVAALETLALAVQSDATPSDAPLPVAPGDAAAPLFGAWVLSGWDSPFFDFPTSVTMTATFDEAGTVTRAFDCGKKKEQPLTTSNVYFVDGDRIMTVPDGREPTGACSLPSDVGPATFTAFLDVFGPISATDEVTWTVDGDTLTIAGLSGVALTLTFERADP
jgi:hypothetical protein